MLDLLLGSSTRAKLLSLFLTRPTEEYYLRELSRRTGQSLRAVQHELPRLERLGLLAVRRHGQHKFYRINQEHPLFRELRSIVHKTEIRRTSSRGDDRVRQAIDKMVTRIVKRFDPERIILFGSHARGNAGRDSDVDLLVVMPVEGSKREKAVEIAVALRDIRIPKDILVTTPEDFEWRKEVVGTIERPASQEGKVLHVRP